MSCKIINILSVHNFDGSIYKNITGIDKAIPSLHLTGMFNEII